MLITKSAKLTAIFSLLLSPCLVMANDMSERSIADRIAPVGQLYLSSAQAVAEQEAPVSAVPSTPEGIYNSYCVACHATGVAGAPIAGDKAAWTPRLAQGREIVNQHAIEGYNAMPAKGTCMSCTDEDIINTINYMLPK